MNRNSKDRTLPSAWIVAGGLLLATACGAAAQEAKPAEPAGPPEKVSIMEIQGKEQFSSRAKKIVETTGVVTQLRDDGVGFWMQDPKGDGDRATSDGIWVSYAGIAGGIDEPLVGDLLRVTGTVDEDQQTPNALPDTRLKSVTRIEVISHGNRLPDPVLITTLPKVELTDGIAFWEPLAGMRVRIGKAIAVSGTEAWGEYSVVTAADAVPGSGYYPNHHILLRSLGDNKVDYNPEVIVLQNASRRAPLVKPGDEFSEIAGNVQYTDGVYKIWPDKYTVQIHELPRPPLAVRSGKMGNLRVVGYNMSNLMDDIDTPGKLEEAYMPKTPAELDTRLEKMAQSIIVELQLPDIITGNEVESAGILQAVGDRVNERTGARYRSASMETYDARGLEVSFLYDENKVHLEEYYQIKGPDVVEAFSPSRPGFIPNRVPLVGVFRVTKSGPRLLVVTNKFKTKRLEDPRLSVNMPSKRFTEVQRKLQAKALRRWVNETLAKDPNALILLTGDFGDFQFGEPGEGLDHPLAILGGLGDEVKLTDFVNLEDPSEAYDYIFQGNSMCVSHMLASPALMKMLVGSDILHINASYPDRLLEDKTTPIRASDRDPIEGRFDFPRDNP